MSHDENLTPTENKAWRNLQRAQSNISSTLDRDLAAEHGLGLADFDVLNYLAESAQKSARMSDLAKNVLLSPSGLTRRLDGLVKAGVVERRRCQSDGRGQLAVLTQQGMSKLEEMRPAHVRSVRKHFINLVSAEQLQQLIDILDGLEVVKLDGEEMSTLRGLNHDTRQAVS